ncbi:MAG: hypothetical protein JWP02_266 [Acidimicrobiales bacterium]|nr:hypothetical protein [Acidimicrobiales bacterium]
MPAVGDVIQIDYESSERLGVLWRSQGREFLEEQAAAVLADLERLRDASVNGAEETAVIDLRDWDVTGLACRRATHSAIAAATRCRNCRQAFCNSCVVYPEATHGEALCTECALVLGGVHHKRSRPVRRRRAGAPAVR